MRGFAWSLVWLLCLGCDDSPADDTPADAGVADGAVAADQGAMSDSGGGTRDEGPQPDGAPVPDAEVPWEVPPTADEVEATPLQLDWLVGWLDGSNGDPIQYAIEHGRFAMPPPGLDLNGVQWEAREQNEDGAWGEFRGGLVWALTAPSVEAGTYLYARTETTAGVYTNGWLQPGDVYHSRRHLVPLAVQPGADNLVAVRGIGGRRAPEAHVWSTTDEVIFNFGDRSWPHLRVGEDEPQHLGIPVSNLTGGALLEVTAKIVENEHFAATELTYPAMGPFSTTQIGFLLEPKAAFAEAEQVIPVRVRIEARGLEWSYERTFELTTIDANAAYLRTYRSPVDHSIQMYGVQAPAEVDPERDYGLVLSLHGAGVFGLGQARAYSKHDWAYVVAPTNRRRFGFDWEVWGQLQGLNSLDDAMETFRIDPTKIHVTGHSMGGHGTWQFGALHPGRFATAGPSAGWMSFYSYTGARRPTSVFARAAASSDTINYLENLARRGVYVIHGSADDNVPVREGRDNFAAVSMVTDDALYHEQEGAGHWWDGDRAGGADCVDWPELFEFMEARALDPFELEFDFRSPGVQVSPKHSYVTLRSAESPLEDLEVHSMPMGETVQLDTQNVRSMVLDGAALTAQGVARVVVNGEELAVTEGAMEWGPQAGKRPGQNGPFNEVFYRPFCYVYPDDEPALAAVAAYYTSQWYIYGNGHACALPKSKLSDAIAGAYNLVHLGGTPDLLGERGWPLDWDDLEVRLGPPGLDARRYPLSAVLVVFPRGDQLDAVMTSSFGEEGLLYRVVPFSSRGVLPDFLIWSQEGGQAAGFLDSEWGWDGRLTVP